MSDDQTKDGDTDLLYGLEDKPPLFQGLMAAVQHLLASLLPVVAPTLIIGSALGLHDQLPYLISMTLIVCGIGTFIQSMRVGPVGSGLLTLQGTSFSFVSAIIAAGQASRGSGATTEEVLALIFGLTLTGCLVEIILSRFLGKLRRIITPTTTGIVITVIGISLLQISINDMTGLSGGDGSGNPMDLALGLAVLVLIVVLSFAPNTSIRTGALLIGTLAGCVAAAVLGDLLLPDLSDQPLLVVPVPFKYGLDFNFVYFVPIAFIYLITVIEAIGDMTANSVISGEPVKGDTYLQRIKGGVLGDGVASALAAAFGTFPNTTFSQNNGVIQITGIASRHIAVYLAVILVLAGLFPIVGEYLRLIPKPVLGAATLLMFGSIAVAGIRILASEPFTRKRIFVMSLSLGLSLGVAVAPDALKMLPEDLRYIFGSPITLAGIVAMVATLLIPDSVDGKNELA